MLSVRQTPFNQCLISFMATTYTGGEDRAGPPQRDTVHWTDETLKELQLNREEVHYIPNLHWVGETGRKNTKTIPTSRGHVHRTYNMMLGIQTVQQSTRPRIITPPHKRVVVPEHVTYPDRNKKKPRNENLVADSPTQPCLPEHP